MREIPILFSAPMVRAILEGRKTVTRRVVRVQPDGHYWESIPGYQCGWRHAYHGHWIFDHRIPQNPQPDGVVRIRCPYGEVGDRLWVRETWSIDPCPVMPFTGPRSPDGGEVMYRATDGWNGPWHPSIHMFRWASRITLEVTSVRVERLQDITHEHAIAEGVHAIDVGSGYQPRYSAITVSWADVVEQQADAYEDATIAFCDLWQSINGPCSWNANPWVWVIEFQKVAGG